MALLQALLALVGRSVGRILDALLGWAVMALFGRTEQRRRTVLTGVVGAAALWPLLVVGIAFPRVAAMLIAFVPLSGRVPANIARGVWILLVLLVPLAVGAVVTATKDEPLWLRLVRGFPITLGVSAAFLLLAVTTPLLRVRGLIRGAKELHLPLSTSADEYRVVTARIDAVVVREGVQAHRVAPPWWLALPSAVLLRLGGRAVAAFVPAHLAYWRGPSLELALYSSDLAVRGLPRRAALAVTVVAEEMGRGPGLSTNGAVAQDLEQQIHGLWELLEDNPRAHTRSPVLMRRLDEVNAALVRAGVDWDDWQVLYRKSLQLGRALHGDEQLLKPHSHEDHAMKPAEADIKIHSAATSELFAELLHQSTALVKAEMTLARAEIRNDVRAELKMVARGVAAALFALWAIDLLLAAAVLGVATAVPAWLAALIVAAPLAAIAIIAAGFAFSQRVRRPMHRTTKSIQENLRWAKERLA